MPREELSLDEPQNDLLAELKARHRELRPRAQRAMEDAEQAMKNARQLALEDETLENAIAALEQGPKAKKRPAKSSARRTNAEMDKIKAAVMKQIEVDPKTSSQIFEELVELGVVTEERKDRDYVMRYLKSLAEHNKTNRAGDSFWVDVPHEPEFRSAAPMPSYDFNEEPF